MIIALNESFWALFSLGWFGPGRLFPRYMAELQTEGLRPWDLVSQSWGWGCVRTCEKGQWEQGPDSWTLCKETNSIRFFMILYAGFDTGVWCFSFLFFWEFHRFWLLSSRNIWPQMHCSCGWIKQCRYFVFFLIGIGSKKPHSWGSSAKLQHLLRVSARSQVCSHRCRGTVNSTEMEMLFLKEEEPFSIPVHL